MYYPNSGFGSNSYSTSGSYSSSPQNSPILTPAKRVLMGLNNNNTNNYAGNETMYCLSFTIHLSFLI